MSFEIPVQERAKSARTSCVGHYEGPELKITDYYEEALVQLFGSLENIPPLTQGERKTCQFSSAWDSSSSSNNYVKMNRFQMCLLHQETFKGNYFIFLITLPPTVSSKTDSHVGWTTNPLVDIFLLNQGETIYKHIDRNISMAIPHWKLDRVVGPLTCEEQAEYFANIWADGTRGMNSKRNKAYFLSEATDAPLYTFTEKLAPDENVEALLNQAYINDQFHQHLLDALHRK